MDDLPVFAPYTPPVEWCPSCPFPEIADPRATVRFCGEHSPTLGGLDDARVGAHEYFQVAEADGVTNRAIQSVIRAAPA